MSDTVTGGSLREQGFIPDPSRTGCFLRWESPTGEFLSAEEAERIEAGRHGTARHEAKKVPATDIYGLETSEIAFVSYKRIIYFLGDEAAL